MNVTDITDEVKRTNSISKSQLRYLFQNAGDGDEEYLFEAARDTAAMYF